MANYDFLSVSDGTGDASLMHITAVRIVGATGITVDSVVGVPAKFIGTSGTLLASGLLDPTTVTNFRGHVAAGALQIDAFEAGSTDKGNSSGQVVIVKPNTGWANRVATFIQNATGLGTPEPHTVSTLAASGLITANGGLTVPTGQPLTLPNNGVTSAMLASPAILRAYAPTDYVGPINTWSTAVLTLNDGVNVGGWVSDGNGWIVPISGKYLVSIQATEQDIPNWGTFGIGEIVAGMGVSATATPPSLPGWYNRKGIGYNPDTLQTSRIYPLAAGQHVFLQTYAGTDTAGNYRLRSGSAADGSWIELTYIAP